MDIEDKLYWLEQIRMDLMDERIESAATGDTDRYDDLEDMIEVIDEVIEDLCKLEELLT